jgi:hypothetical protein
MERIVKSFTMRKLTVDSSVLHISFTGSGYSRSGRSAWPAPFRRKAERSVSLAAAFRIEPTLEE